MYSHMWEVHRVPCRLWWWDNGWWLSDCSASMLRAPPINSPVLEDGHLQTEMYNHKLSPCKNYYWEISDRTSYKWSLEALVFSIKWNITLSMLTTTWYEDSLFHIASVYPAAKWVSCINKAVLRACALYAASCSGISLRGLKWFPNVQDCWGRKVVWTFRWIQDYKPNNFTFTFLIRFDKNLQNIIELLSKTRLYLTRWTINICPLTILWKL